MHYATVIQMLKHKVWKISVSSNIAFKSVIFSLNILSISNIEGLNMYPYNSLIWNHSEGFRKNSNFSRLEKLSFIIIIIIIIIISVIKYLFYNQSNCYIFAINKKKT